MWGISLCINNIVLYCHIIIWCTLYEKCCSNLEILQIRTEIINLKSTFTKILENLCKQTISFLKRKLVEQVMSKNFFKFRNYNLNNFETSRLKFKRCWLCTDGDSFKDYIEIASKVFMWKSQKCMRKLS